MESQQLHQTPLLFQEYTRSSPQKSNKWDSLFCIILYMLLLSFYIRLRLNLVSKGMLVKYLNKNLNAFKTSRLILG